MKLLLSRQPVAALLLLLLLAGGAVRAQANENEGRIKIPLSREAVGIDDVAHFAESFVHRQLYKDRFAQSQRRFYVREFIGVEQTGEQADIRFIVLDMKENTTFSDSMRIYRGQDGVWRYRPDNGKGPVEIYTFVMKWGYYYQRYLLPASVVGMVLASVLLVYLRCRRRKISRA